MKKLILLAIAVIFSCGVFAQQSTAKVTIQTNGVCQKCADLFNSQVPYFKGVKDYSYDAKTAKITVTYDAAKTNPDQLRAQISKLGYNADGVEADPAARAKLPACCRGEKSCGTQTAPQKDAQHKCSHDNSSQHKCTHGQASKDAQHKCTHNSQSKNLQANPAKSAAHKCSGQKDPNHKCSHSK